MMKLSTMAAAEIMFLIFSGNVVAAGADMGRLFFSPAERDAFQAARRAAKAPPVAEIIEPEPEINIEPLELIVQEPLPTITLDGYVRRSNGRATLWINGENSYDGDLSASEIDPPSVKLYDKAVRVSQTGRNGSVRLKPGQSYDPNSTSTTDAYEVPLVVDDFYAP